MGVAEIIAWRLFQTYLIIRVYMDPESSKKDHHLKLGFLTPRTFLITILTFSSLIFLYANYKVSKSSEKRRKLLKDLSLRY